MAEWRDVAGYKGTYQVSKGGQVKGRGGKILSPYKVNGYPHVELWKNGKHKAQLVRNLVAAAFSGKRPTGTEVHEKNANREDTRATNLKYATHSANLLSRKK